MGRPTPPWDPGSDRVADVSDPVDRRNLRITGNRAINQDRSLVVPDNGWTPYASDLTIQEVPGDHDSMVLEPHVRVMVSHLREALTRAEHRASSRPLAAE